MDRDLRQFAAQWLRVVTMALAPVVLATFLSVPLAIGRHPGEPARTGAPAPVHMT